MSQPSSQEESQLKSWQLKDLAKLSFYQLFFLSLYIKFNGTTYFPLRRTASSKLRSSIAAWTALVCKTIQESMKRLT